MADIVVTVVVVAIVVVTVVIVPQRLQGGAETILTTTKALEEIADHVDADVPPRLYHNQVHLIHRAAPVIHQVVRAVQVLLQHLG